MWWLAWAAAALLLIKTFNRLTTGRCYCDTVMTGQVVVVTGASGGIGYETALELARRGAKVIVACRDEERGKMAVRQIVRETRNIHVRFIRLDLASLKSVRGFVEEFKRTEAKLDVLINNAGAICPRRTMTVDGIVKDMQINHFGPFLLTVLLVPMLRRSAPSRVVVVSSAVHRIGRVRDVNDISEGYFQAYANSKLCNVLFSNELARRLAGGGVTANSLNPGQANTALYRSSSALEALRSLALGAFFRSAREAAQTAVYLAVADECADASGGYFEECREARAAPRARDAQLAAQLWTLSEELVRLAPEEAI
ncbi:unnamed protein product, partial [Iphiclides podalirius]